MAVTKPTAAVLRTSDMDTIRDEINVFLRGYYAGRKKQADEVHTLYERLWSGLAETHLSGGKRVRPYLAVLVYEAFGGTDRAGVMPACAAVELMHAAMLIHDDIIDRDLYRHGRPNLLGRYRQHYQTIIPDDAERTHFAEGAALLGGDVLISDAFELLTQTRLEPERQVDMLRLMNEAMYRVVGGELLDVETTFYPPGTVDAIQIAELKTAFYSFSLPLELGAIMAGVSPAERALLRQLGCTIGVAFQLADDLLGMYGTTAETGKPVGSDLREGKRSLLMQRGLELASETERAELLAALHDADGATDSVERVCAILDGCGARREIEDLMTDYYGRAERLIARLPIAETSRNHLLKLAGQAIWRRS